MVSQVRISVVGAGSAVSTTTAKVEPSIKHPDMLNVYVDNERILDSWVP